MTNYNDGNWHGWNGGECPVHPKTLVDYVWHDPRMNSAGIGFDREAHEDEGPHLAWPHVVKFRVVKEHREPREWWAVGMHLHNSEADAMAFRVRCDAMSPGGGHLNTPIVHVREVL